MKNELVKTVDELKKNHDLESYDKASVKAAVVLKLVSLLGWDPFNIKEVRPEYGIGGKQVDYALRISNRNKVFLNVAKITESLEDNQKPLIDFSTQENVKMAVLTNGVTWWFYLALAEGTPDQCRVCKIDLLQQEPGDIADRFIEFLSKENIQTAKAYKTAEKVYKSRQRKTVIQKILPKAWELLIQEPANGLVDLLIETTENMAGFKPEAADVRTFLESVRTSGDIQVARVENVAPAMSWRPGERMGSGVIDYNDRNIDSIIFLGVSHRPKSWSDLLVIVASELHKRHQENFQKYLSLSGSKTMYFSTDRNLLNRPRKVAGSQYYAETKLDPNTIVKRSRELMGLFGHKDSELEIFVKR
ncbi:MAG: hypothetical protein QNI92_03290 [Desulfobacterales bacterium]|nr:hypothetical protein [Desulfobacterales bacterium]MDJ0915717.1 hypothetical protein [Desulfobacterales bacterium]